MHEVMLEPRPLAALAGLPAGWAAVYAPRRPGSGMDQLAAQLREFGQDNFSGTRPCHTPGLSQIWHRDWLLTVR